MRKIIDDIQYDTERAEKIATMPCTFNRGDVHFHETSIFRTPSGRWFLAGEGGALSIWAQPVGQHGSCGGWGIMPISEDEAREELERSGAEEAFKRFFPVRDA